MQELVNRIAGKVGEVMTDYATKHGYTLVLDASQSQDSPTVLYAVPSIDITKAVIDAYNEKSRRAAPVQAAEPCDARRACTGTRTQQVVAIANRSPFKGPAPAGPLLCPCVPAGRPRFNEVFKALAV